MALSQKQKDEKRAQWRRSDPVEFECNERRREQWEEMKAKARSAPAHHSTFTAMGLEPEGGVTDTHSALVAKASDDKNNPESIFAELRNEVEADYRYGQASHRFNTLMIELCCDEQSALSQEAPKGAISIRVTKQVDLTNKKTLDIVHCILDYAAEKGLTIMVWVSIPCTAGCPLRHLNNAIGIQTGDPILTDKLIEAGVGVCRHACRLKGDYAWEWSERSSPRCGVMKECIPSSMRLMPITWP